ncbi:MAG: chitobiase/beta-hexosaminidase C-terminal domain-containing protein [Phaeodactylibacter sp.]|nr:chitobiase/beta-hexosaminidase C-terminal domain-containing protein [Phaeodactylibacter sp.]MCB9052375.1 chitobiase/beta-hexosaminidase C-terminal domain-containing protein [Lewinellaceae bacterium]
MKPLPALFLLSFLFSCSAVRETEGALPSGMIFQLASPQCRVDSVLFVNSALLSLELDYPDVAIRYTDNGEDVSLNSRLYTGPIRVSTSGAIHARAFHPDFLPSEIVSRQVRKISAAALNASVAVHPEPHSSYPGNGPRSLVDLQKGSAAFRNGNYWMGFQADTVDISLSLDTEKPVGLVTLSVLEDNASWIFLPRSAEVFVDGKLVGRKDWPASTSPGTSALQFLEIPVAGTTGSTIQVRVANWPSIPDWHPGKGTPPWFFIDELLIN